MALPIQSNKVNNETAEKGEGEMSKIKVSSIPLYPEPEKWDYYVNPPTSVENFVKESRIQINAVKAEYQPILDQIDNIVNTGKAHTNETLISLRREENLLGRVGVTMMGGLVGLLAARKGRFFKKITYFSTGIGAAGSICYPNEAKIAALDAGQSALKNARIAYHFVVGTRPSLQNEDGQAFQRVSGMVSDVGKWGFKLFEKEKPVQKEIVTKIADEPSPSEKAIEEPNKSEDNIATSAVVEEVIVSSSEPAVEAEIIILEEPSKSEVNVQATELPFPEMEAPIPTPYENIIKEDIPTKDTTVESANQSADPEVLEPASVTSKQPLILEGDLGQGSLEDKELYTTRE